MKAEFANPFIRSAVSVVETETGVKLNRKDLKLKDSASPSMPTFIIIGATGFIKGQVVYSMDANFALAITKSMMPGKSAQELQQLVNSAVSELANMITGRASIELAGEDQTISITPPAVFTGNEITMDFLAIPTIAISFISSIGMMEINIALTQE